ncbi:MAG: hypothetical protein KAJ51_09940 [Thermoplasmata archaeon]|nr:hypothetical protein [Thermoplasmata archaeon]
MKKNIDTWSHAKGYSYSNRYFGFSIFFLILSLIFLLSPFYITDPFNLLILFFSGIIIFIGMIIILYLILRDISRQNNWIYKEYPTNLKLNEEKSKEQIMNIIGKIVDNKKYKISEVPYRNRFPVDLIKSIVINNKIQMDVCIKFLQNLSINPFKPKYKYWIVIFLGPLNENNISLSEKLKKEFDKDFII